MGKYRKIYSEGEGLSPLHSEFVCERSQIVYEPSQCDFDLFAIFDFCELEFLNRLLALK